jgi:hypothetical protein
MIGARRTRSDPGFDPNALTGVLQLTRGSGVPMTTVTAARQTFSLANDSLLNYIRAIIYDGRDGSDKLARRRGPWDAVARYALASTATFGPYPEQWRLASLRFESQTQGASQPMLRRFAFFVGIARAVISRAELFAEIAEFMRRGGDGCGVVLFQEYVARFVDDFCGPQFRLRYPFHGPRPGWYCETLDGVDLTAISTELEQAAKQTASPELARSLAIAALRFGAAGRAKLRAAETERPSERPYLSHPYGPAGPDES